MRTTLTLDDDVAAKLKSEARRTGRSFKQIVNDFLRHGLNARKENRKQQPFHVKPKNMGIREGLDYDNIGELLEQVEGPAHK